MHESRYNLNIVLTGWERVHKVSVFENSRGRIYMSEVRVLVITGLACQLIHRNRTACIQVLN